MALPPRHHGRLALDLACEHGRTVIARQRAAPPLQIFGLQHDAAGAVAYLQIVNPAGGLCEGDSAEVEIALQAGAHLYLTTQAATKIYPAERGEVTRQRTRLRVASGAVLEYVPLPLIPFARALYAQELSIHIEADGVCLATEVLAPGRAARGERFAYHRLRSRVEGWVGDRLALFDQMILEPQRRSPEGLALLDGKAYVATLYVLTSWPLEPRIPAWNRRLMERDGGCVGITALAHGGLVVRLLGHTGQDVLRRLEAVHRLIREEGLGLPPLRVYRPFD
jgi:urease accessory protein